MIKSCPPHGGGALPMLREGGGGAFYKPMAGVISY